MSDIFVFYHAHTPQGSLRYNNIVFKDCSPIATIDDIKDLENTIMKMYDYDDCKIQNWRRMEVITKPISIEDEEPK